MRKLAIVVAVVVVVALTPIAAAAAAPTTTAFCTEPRGCPPPPQPTNPDGSLRIGGPTGPDGAYPLPPTGSSTQALALLGAMLLAAGLAMRRQRAPM